MISLAEYLDKNHNGKIDRVAVRKLDFSTINSIGQMIDWAFDAFNVPKELQDNVSRSDLDAVLDLLWDAIPKNKKSFAILCSYPGHLSPEIKPVFDKWERALGWGLWRDYTIHATFVQDPETKGKKPPTNGLCGTANPPRN